MPFRHTSSAFFLGRYFLFSTEYVLVVLIFFPRQVQEVYLDLLVPDPIITGLDIKQNQMSWPNMT